MPRQPLRHVYITMQNSRRINGTSEDTYNQQNTVGNVMNPMLSEHS